MASVTYPKAGQKRTAAGASAALPQPPQAVTPLNSWANHSGATAFSARLENPVTVRVVGTLDPGTVTAGTEIGALPDSGMYPATRQAGTGVILAGTSAGTTFGLLVGIAGGITLAAALSGATEVQVSFTFPLDL